MNTIFRIGITVGDPKGIGPEITLKSLASEESIPAERVSFRLYGVESGLTEASSFTGLPLPDVDFTASSTELEAIQQATEDALAGQIDAIVTGPISKDQIRKEIPSFCGHTEYFAELAGVSGTTMLFAARDIKIAQATTHISIRDLPNALTKEVLNDTIARTIDGLKLWWGIKEPRIAICGLNPHAGENGAFGNEEDEVIRPVISKWQAENQKVFGPFGGDTILTPPLQKRI
ncbi:PdxA family protein [Bdellovibrionota bacterium]